jgi:hypothetical protein
MLQGTLASVTTRVPLGYVQATLREGCARLARAGAHRHSGFGAMLVGEILSFPFLAKWRVQALSECLRPAMLTQFMRRRCRYWVLALA